MTSVSTGKSLPEEVRLRMELGERRQQFDGGSWTNEKHICFLNWMEASFVKKMRGNDAQDDGHLPLDRNLPDGSDSTLDFQSRRRNVNGKRPQANSREFFFTLSLSLEYFFFVKNLGKFL